MRLSTGNSLGHLAEANSYTSLGAHISSHACSAASRMPVRPEQTIQITKGLKKPATVRESAAGTERESKRINVPMFTVALFTVPDKTKQNKTKATITATGNEVKVSWPGNVTQLLKNLEAFPQGILLRSEKSEKWRWVHFCRTTPKKAKLDPKPHTCMHVRIST